jgi:hypothetical protein
MDLASGFAQPSLACAEQIWERAQNPASASKALFSIVIFCGAFDRERRLEANKPNAATVAGGLS